MIDQKFMQDLKDNKHLTEFGISQETIDFVNSTKDKYKIIPNFGEFKEHGRLAELV